jgi:hypothetical protein
MFLVCTQIALLLLLVVLLMVVMMLLLAITLSHSVSEGSRMLVGWFVLVGVVLLLQWQHWWVPVLLLGLMVVPLVDSAVVVVAVLVVVVDLLAVLPHAAVLFALVDHFDPLRWLLFAVCWMNALLHGGSVFNPLSFIEINC